MKAPSQAVYGHSPRRASTRALLAAYLFLYALVSFEALASSSSSSASAVCAPKACADGLMTYELRGANARKITWHCPPAYKDPQYLAQGAYGSVFQCKRIADNKEVAVKCLNTTQRDVCAADLALTLSEVKLLKCLKHNNVTSCLDTWGAANSQKELEHVYIAMEKMPCTLQRILDGRVVLEMAHVRYIVYQLLLALRYLESAQVLHCDLKPANILIDEQASIRIADFGISRLTSARKHIFGPYLVTRFYRAPEVYTPEVYNRQELTPAIDMWAAGCILAELVLKRPLFAAGSAQQHFALLESFQKDPLPFLSSLKSLAKDALYDDLLSKMLTFNPQKRISPSAALKHPFFASIRRAGDEQTYQGEPLAEQFAFCEENKDKAYFLQLLSREVQGSPGSSSPASDSDSDFDSAPENAEKSSE